MRKVELCEAGMLGRVVARWLARLHCNASLPHGHVVPWPAESRVMEGCRSLHAVAWEEANRHKWIESKKAGRDLGPAAIDQWVRDHWYLFVRYHWLEHIQGAVQWAEFNPAAFGRLNREYPTHTDLIRHILARLTLGAENADFVYDPKAPISRPEVIEILTVCDINSCRIACKFWTLPGSQSSFHV